MKKGKIKIHQSKRTRASSVREQAVSYLATPKGSESKQEGRAVLERKYASYLKNDFALGKLISYVGNKDVPLLRLYRYKEAFSLGLVQELIRRMRLNASDYIFDPFAGMGTTLFGSMLMGIPSVGVDKLPIAVFLSETLPKFFLVKAGQIEAQLPTVLKHLKQAPFNAKIADDVRIMKVAFDENILKELCAIKASIERLKSPFREIYLILFLSILEETSYTSKDGQFLRLIRDKVTTPPMEALCAKVRQAEEDLKRINWMASNGFPTHYTPQVFYGSTLELSEIPFKRSPTAIITSPPYANRYDYTRSYSLELCFQFVANFEELKKLRFSILRSHIEAKAFPGEQPCHPAVEEIVGNLQKKTLNNPKIPVFLTAYFNDMQQAIRQWSRMLAPRAKVALVVDNVRFEGEMVPVDLILSDIAEQEGFSMKQIWVARYKGNSSQQMGKYGRVPVRESVVLWEKN